MKSASERLIEAGYDEIVIFENPSYDDALIGVTTDDRAVYDFNKNGRLAYRKQRHE